MTEHRSALRTPWIAPIAVAGVVAVGLLAQPLLASGEGSNLPDLTAEELVAQVLEAEPQAMSGTVVHTARLGLPDLLFTEATGADPMSLLGGSSTLRVWTDGAERARVSLLGTMSEYSVVADGTDVWTYSSSDDEVLAGVEEHSTVRVDSQVSVAGRDAYQLVITPDTDGTLVDHVVLAVDGETMTPLRVQTWSTQDETAPALEVSFTDVDFSAPAESVFQFSTPAGATQRDVVVPLPEEGTEMPAHEGEHQKPTVIGTGWESVVELTGVDMAKLIAQDPGAISGMPVPSTGSDEAGELIEEFKPEHGPGMDLDAAALYEQLTTEVPEGRLLSSTLLSVLVTDDGRVLVGAVPAETLRAMA